MTNTFGVSGDVLINISKQNPKDAKRLLNNKSFVKFNNEFDARVFQDRLYGTYSGDFVNMERKLKKELKEERRQKSLSSFFK